MQDAGMPAHLDLTTAPLHRRFGDLTLVYTYVNDERAMVLLANLRPGSPWFVVTESVAPDYDDPMTLWHKAQIAAEVLGIEPSRANLLRISSILHEGLPDLIRLPTPQERELERAARGAMVLREGGKEIAGQDIRFEKDTGATYE